MMMYCRRAEIKGKVAKLTTNFVGTVQEHMRQQLETQLDECTTQVSECHRPPDIHMRG